MIKPKLPELIEGVLERLETQNGCLLSDRTTKKVISVLCCKECKYREDCGVKFGPGKKDAD